MAHEKKSSNVKSTNTLQEESGVVIAPPSVFNNHSLAIAGEDLPIRLTAKRQWPAIKAGDTIIVKGKPSTTAQGTVLRVSNPSFVHVTRHGPEPKPEAISIDDAFDHDEGDLIQITGTIRDIRAKSWLVEDADNEITVVPPTQLPRPPFEGDKVTITGIMENTSTGQRLHARFGSDVVLPTLPPASALSKTITAPKPANSSAPLIVFGIMLAIGLGILVVKEPKLRIPTSSSTTVLTPEPEPVVADDGTLQLPPSFQAEENNL